MNNLLPLLGERKNLNELSSHELSSHFQGSQSVEILFSFSEVLALVLGLLESFCQFELQLMPELQFLGFPI